MPSGFEDPCELRISVVSDSENQRFSECVISSDFMVCDFCRLSEFVSLCDFLDFEISRFSDFPTSSGLLECVISRFFDFVFSPECQDVEISQFLDFRLSGFVDVWLFGLFDFLGFSNVGCPTFSGIVDSTITK